MSKTIVVYCGAEGCGAVIAKRVVPDIAVDQAKALVPAVMLCPNAPEKHAEYPAVHVRVEIEPGPSSTKPKAPAQKPKPVIESGTLATPFGLVTSARTVPTTPPPPPAPQSPPVEPEPVPPLPEGATLGMTHLGRSTTPDGRKYEADEMPSEDVDDEALPEDPREWWEQPAAPSDGSEPDETPET